MFGFALLPFPLPLTHYVSVGKVHSLRKPGNPESATGTIVEL